MTVYTRPVATRCVHRFRIFRDVARWMPSVRPHVAATVILLGACRRLLHDRVGSLDIQFGLIQDLERVHVRNAQVFVRQ